MRERAQGAGAGARLRRGRLRADRIAGMRRLLLFVVAVGGPLAILVAAERFVLPAAIGIERDRFLMGFVSQLPVQDDVPLNALGLTGDVPAAERPEGGLRVLTLGASVLFNRHITRKLDEALERATGRPVETLGGALPSHTSWSSVHKYAYLRRHRFDVVLLYEGINDLLANHVAKEDFRADYRHLNAWYDRRGPLSSSLIARVLYNDFLYRPALTVWNEEDHPSEAVLRGNLHRLIDAVREDGGHPVPMTFAWLVPDGYDQEKFFQGRAGYHPPDRADAYPVELWGGVSWVRRGLVRTNAVVYEVAGEKGLPVLDMQQRMRGDPDLFVDVCHLSDEGVARFVDEVVAFLGEQGLLDPAGSSAR